MIELFLLKEVSKLGQAGEIVKVKDGFGVNYLIPQNFARRVLEQDWELHKIIQLKQIKRKQQRKKFLSYLQNVFVSALEKKPLRLEGAAASGGKLFESIKEDQIWNILQQTFDKFLMLSRSEVKFKLPRKVDLTGRYSFEMIVKLKEQAEGITVPLYVNVVSVSKTIRAKRSKKKPEVK